MKKEFKVGDRVCYRWTDNQLRKGVISSISKDGRVEMKPIEKSLFLDSWVAHVSWLKRLVKQKAREFWIPKSWDENDTKWIGRDGIRYLELRPDPEVMHDFIRVREVKVRK